jgi:hypothetical protein
MTKSTITLNEAQFRTLVEECVNEVLLEEGFEDIVNNVKAAGKAVGRTFNNIKGAVGAGKNYMQSQKLLHQGIDNRNWLGNAGDEFLQHHNYAQEGHDNLKNTASEQANEIYKQMKYHAGMAAKLGNLLQQFDSKYGLISNKSEMDRMAAEKGQKSQWKKGNEIVRYAPDTQLVPNKNGTNLVAQINNNPSTTAPITRKPKFAKTARQMYSDYGDGQGPKNRNTLGL